MTRSEECNRKLMSVREMLDLNGLDGIIIKKQANFSWLTVGGRGFIASICARQGGLVASVTRIVSFEEGFAKDYDALLRVLTPCGPLWPTVTVGGITRPGVMCR